MQQKRITLILTLAFSQKKKMQVIKLRGSWFKEREKVPATTWWCCTSWILWNHADFFTYIIFARKLERFSYYHHQTNDKKKNKKKGRGFSGDPASFGAVSAYILELLQEKNFVHDHTCIIPWAVRLLVSFKLAVLQQTAMTMHPRCDSFCSAKISATADIVESYFFSFVRCFCGGGVGVHFIRQSLIQKIPWVDSSFLFFGHLSGVDSVCCFFLYNKKKNDWKVEQKHGGIGLFSKVLMGLEV